MDGVNSMTGNAPDIAAFARLANEHDALLYVDDAHGFGVIGERSPDELCDYGTSGNSLLRHQDVPYDNVILVAGFSKAYSSLLAFIALPTRLKDAFKVLAPPYLYSGPVARRIARDHDRRARGEPHPRRRRSLRDLATDPSRARRAGRLGIVTPNESGFPIIEVPLADHSEIDRVGRYLFDEGVYTTMAAYPLVPKDEVGFRIQVTAANTDEEVEHLIEVVGSLRERFQLRQTADASA